MLKKEKRNQKKSIGEKRVEENILRNTNFSIDKKLLKILIDLIPDRLDLILSISLVRDIESDHRLCSCDPRLVSCRVDLKFLVSDHQKVDQRVEDFSDLVCLVSSCRRLLICPIQNVICFLLIATSLDVVIEVDVVIRSKDDCLDRVEWDSLVRLLLLFSDDDIAILVDQRDQNRLLE